MDCFEACTPPATAYGTLLRNQQELIARIRRLESLASLCGAPGTGAGAIPLYEFGTGTFLGNLTTPLIEF